MSLLKNQLGFTLIELMIVVGIIGIFVSLAVPNFSKYQRRARQSEAKIALGAIYALEQSFYSEYSAYNPAFDAIGYAPEGRRRFYRVSGCISCDGTPWAGTITGYTGTSLVQSYNETLTPFGLAWNPATACTISYYNGAALGNDPQVFSPTAAATLCSTCTTDWWVINNLKLLQNCAVGL